MITVKKINNNEINIPDSFHNVKRNLLMVMNYLVNKSVIYFYPLKRILVKLGQYSIF